MSERGKTETLTVLPNTVLIQLVQTLQGVVEDNKYREEALQRKIKFLEEIIEQREKSTAKNWMELRTRMNALEHAIWGLFINDVPRGMGLTHTEIIELYKKCFPQVPFTSVETISRRVRQLVTDGKLRRLDDPDGTARFFLALEKRDGEENL